MTSFLRYAKLIFCCLILTGCATVELDRAALKENKIKNIQYDAFNLTYEESISGANSGGATGGFIGAMVGAGIDAGINAKRKNNFAPIVDALNNFYINPILKEKLLQVKGESFSNEIKVTKSNGFVKTKDIEPHILYLNANYTISPNHRLLSANFSFQYKASADANVFRDVITGTEELNVPKEKVSISEVTSYLTENIDIVKEKIISLTERIVPLVETYFNTEPEN